MRCRDCVKLATTVAALVAAGAGCGVYYSPLVRRASNEFGCSPAQINVIERGDIGYQLYDVDACGTRARYSCVSATRYEPGHCIREPDPPRWDPDPALAASLPSWPQSNPPPSGAGQWRRICSRPRDEACTFKQDGVWQWRPPNAYTCTGGYGSVCN
jgi:hypothetical protein